MVSLRPVPAADSVELEQWRPNAWALMVTVAVLAGLCMGLLATFIASEPFSGRRFHMWQWQAENLPGTVLEVLGMTRSTGEDAGINAVERYFQLTSQIRTELESESPDRLFIEALASERAAYENDVERLVEAYIGEAIGEAGLERSLPLFGDVAFTWPPVQFELTSPPRLLVKSPRDEIRRSDALLKNDLTLAEIEEIETETDDEDTVSLVVSVGGIAAYPAIIRDDRSYDSLLTVAAHEWAHHYLAFFPLGQQWGTSGDATTLNESTADIAGREIANLVRAMHPVALPEGEDGRAPPGPEPGVDFRTVMRELRLDVDGLLAEGMVEEAEALMEQQRLYLAENGIFIRKINQAYFAFYGSYGDSPASSSPIGPKVERVWELTQDVGAFLGFMRDVRDEGDLDRLIERLEGAIESRE